MNLDFDFILSFENRINKSINWLINSKIHNFRPEDNQLFGSFNNYYDIRKKSCQYAYTEITGYGIELLLDLYKKTTDPEYLKQAKLAADWVLKMQYADASSQSGGYLYSIDLDSRIKSNELYSFDAGICLGGLSDLYQTTGIKAYLKSAEKSANWLISQMQNPDGSFKHLYNTSTGLFASDRFVPNSIRKSWFYKSGCHHGKIAIGLLKYYNISKAPLVMNSVLSLCDWLLKQQTSRGNFRIVPDSNVTFSHTHCYAVEGLLFASNGLEDKKLFDSAKLGGDWLISLQRKDGRLPAWINDRGIRYTDISAVAQSIRIWCVLYSKTGEEKYKMAIEKSLRYLIKMENGDLDNLQQGGFYLAELDFNIFKPKVKRLYSWATMFAIHALNLVNDLKSRHINEIELW